jgi:hypothetical protein
LVGGRTVEIMQTVLDEAQESYSPLIVLELQSTEHDDLERGIDKVKAWVESYIKEMSEEEGGE